MLLIIISNEQLWKLLDLIWENTHYLHCTYIQHEIEHAGARTLMFSLTPECITGKIVNEW